VYFTKNNKIPFSEKPLPGIILSAERLNNNTREKQFSHPAALSGG
jgi:hypothetical protein